MDHQPVESLKDQWQMRDCEGSVANARIVRVEEFVKIVKECEALFQRKCGMVLRNIFAPEMHQEEVAPGSEDLLRRGVLSASEKPRLADWKESSARDLVRWMLQNTKKA